MGRKPDIADLERRLGYAFRSRALLREALTHASSRTASVADNERLEFLGDRVLGLAIAASLVERYPDAREGELARRFNRLVRRETCADVATALDLGAHLIMTPGEVHGGGRRKPAILADACEALFGAVFRDGGFEAARPLILKWWEPHFEACAEARPDAKTALQEFAQSEKRGLPVYEIVATSGTDHAPRSVAGARVAGKAPARGEGPSKPKAQQAAAEAMLLREHVWMKPQDDDV